MFISSFHAGTSPHDLRNPSALIVEVMRRDVKKEAETPDGRPSLSTSG